MSFSRWLTALLLYKCVNCAHLLRLHTMKSKWIACTCWIGADAHCPYNKIWRRFTSTGPFVNSFSCSRKANYWNSLPDSDITMNILKCLLGFCIWLCRSKLKKGRIKFDDPVWRRAYFPGQIHSYVKLLLTLFEIYRHTIQHFLCAYLLYCLLMMWIRMTFYNFNNFGYVHITICCIDNNKTQTHTHTHTRNTQSQPISLCLF